MRKLPNGQYYIPRPSASDVAYMNENYERVSRNIWRDRLAFKENADYRALQPHFKGKAYIVAKGKSIDSLTADHFEPDIPIMATNEAIMVVDALDLPNVQVGLRQDGKSRYYIPTKGYMLVRNAIMSYYHAFENTIPWVYETPTTMCTLALALHVAKLLGTKEVIIYGADLHTSRQLQYSDCAPKRDHKPVSLQLDQQSGDLKAQSRGMECKWMKSDLESWLTEL